MGFLKCCSTADRHPTISLSFFLFFAEGNSLTQLSPEPGNHTYLLGARWRFTMVWGCRFAYLYVADQRPPDWSAISPALTSPSIYLSIGLSVCVGLIGLIYTRRVPHSKPCPVITCGLAVATLLLKFVFLTYNKINFSCTNYDIIDIKLTEVLRLTA